MQKQEYRFIFYLDAIHSIEIDDKRGEAHRHTWKIGITVSKLKEHFIIFNEFEKIIDDFLARYQDENFDEIDYFLDIIPTIENITNFFKEQLSEILIDMGWQLLQIEISDSPNRTYIIKTDADFVSEKIPTKNYSEPAPIKEQSRYAHDALAQLYTAAPIAEPDYVKPFLEENSGSFTEHFAGIIPAPLRILATEPEEKQAETETLFFGDILNEAENFNSGQATEEFVLNELENIFGKSNIQENEITFPEPEIEPIAEPIPAPIIESPVEPPEPLFKTTTEYSSLDSEAYIPKPIYSYTIPGIAVKPSEGFFKSAILNENENIEPTEEPIDDPISTFLETERTSLITPELASITSSEKAEQPLPTDQSTSSFYNPFSKITSAPLEAIKIEPIAPEKVAEAPPPLNTQAATSTEEAPPAPVNPFAKRAISAQKTVLDTKNEKVMDNIKEAFTKSSFDLNEETKETPKPETQHHSSSNANVLPEHKFKNAMQTIKNNASDEFFIEEAVLYKEVDNLIMNERIRLKKQRKLFLTLALILGSAFAAVIILKLLHII